MYALFPRFGMKQDKYCQDKYCDGFAHYYPTGTQKHGVLSLINKDLQMFLDGFEMRKIYRIEGFSFNIQKVNYLYESVY